MTREYSSISVESTLNSGINTTATTMVLPSVAAVTALLGGVSLAAGNVDIFTVAIDVDTINEEIVYVTGVSGDTLTISRGQAGTGTPGVSGIAHSAGASVKHVLTSSDLIYFRDGVEEADVAIPKSVVTTKGDLITATASATPARLGVGSNDQVLIADSATATGLKWGDVSATPRIGQVIQTVTGTVTGSTSSTYADATDMFATITPTKSTSKILITINFNCSIDGRIDVGVNWAKFRINRGATQLYELSNFGQYATFSSGAFASYTGVGNNTLIYLDSPATTSATTYKLQFARAGSNGTISINNGSSQQGTVTLQEVLV